MVAGSNGGGGIIVVIVVLVLMLFFYYLFSGPQRAVYLFAWVGLTDCEFFDVTVSSVKFDGDCERENKKWRELEDHAVAGRVCPCVVSSGRCR